MQLHLLALMFLSAGGTTRVQNPCPVLAEPKFWARRVGEVGAKQSVTILKTEGGWYEIRLANRKTGYVPRSAFEAKVAEFADMHFEGPAPSASATQASNASRGFSKDAHAADVSKSGLDAADKVLDTYVSGPAAAKLDSALASEMPGFVSKGKLGGGEL